MREINFLGYKVNILDDDTIDQQAALGQLHYYICIRVADSDPTLGSPELLRRRTRTLCEKCSAVCWMDPLSFDSLRKLKTMIICAQCMVDKHKEETQADA